jgi:hypothetical protein
MTVLGLLARALVQNRDGAYSKLQIQREDVIWAIGNLAHEPYFKTLKAVLLYAKKMQATPDSFVTLRQFIQINSDSLKFFKKDGVKDAIYQELETLETDDAEIATDTNLLLESAFDEGLKAYDLNTLIEEIDIRKGATCYPKDSDETGINAALAFRQDRMAKRREKKPLVVDGDLRENIDYVNETLNRFLSGDEGDRILTDFIHLDTTTLIGPGYQNRWIGILGYTNHGKSMYLMSMLYNMAKAGKRILLVPRECSVEEAWMRFVFMHAINFPDLPMISLNEWQMSKGKIPLDVWASKEFLIKDLKEGDTLQGAIDVKQFDTLQQSLDYVKAKDATTPFDVVAYDYLAHLEVKTSKSLNEIEAHKADFRRCQMISQNGIMNDKKGLTIITPMQANKAGYDKAAKAEGDEWGIYESLAAIDWYTQAAHDMDLVISVFYEGDLKESDPPEMIISCLKSRAEKFFPTHKVRIDVKTRYVHDIGKVAGKRIKTAEDIVAEITGEMVSQVANLNEDIIDPVIG